MCERVIKCIRCDACLEDLNMFYVLSIGTEPTSLNLGLILVATSVATGSLLNALEYVIATACTYIPLHQV